MIQYNAGLVYKDESGALNEHIADVFGIMVKQMHENEDSKNADWLIGEGCLLPGVKGVSLRSMKQPGTAYDDPRFVSSPCLNLMSVIESNGLGWVADDETTGT